MEENPKPELKRTKAKKMISEIVENALLIDKKYGVDLEESSKRSVSRREGLWKIFEEYFEIVD